MNSVREINLSGQSIRISQRPGLQNFLDQITKIFEVIVFTASERNYASKVIEIIDPKKCIDSILSRENCISLGNSEYLKDIYCLERDEGSVVIVDNSLGAVKQTEALIPILSYYGDEEDNQLNELLPYLKDLSKQKNMIKKNKEMFQWDLMLKANNYHEDYFQIIRKNYENFQKQD